MHLSVLNSPDTCSQFYMFCIHLLVKVSLKELQDNHHPSKREKPTTVFKLIKHNSFQNELNRCYIRLVKCVFSYCLPALKTQ